MSLPPRQLQVLQMLADGGTVQSIARALWISTSSIREYKIRLFDHRRRQDHLPMAWRRVGYAVKPSARVCGGIFQPDLSLPADHRGRLTCVCGLTGEAGDAHHTPAVVPEQAEHAARYDHDEGAT